MSLQTEKRSLSPTRETPPAPREPERDKMAKEGWVLPPREPDTSLPWSAAGTRVLRPSALLVSCLQTADSQPPQSREPLPSRKPLTHLPVICRCLSICAHSLDCFSGGPWPVRHVALPKPRGHAAPRTAGPHGATGSHRASHGRATRRAGHTRDHDHYPPGHTPTQSAGKCQDTELCPLTNTAAALGLSHSVRGWAPPRATSSSPTSHPPAVTLREQVSKAVDASHVTVDSSHYK